MNQEGKFAIKNYFSIEFGRVKIIFSIIFVIMMMFETKSQNIWEKPSYGPKNLIFNIGSGAFIRHFEPNYFNDRYSNYTQKSQIGLSNQTL